MRKSTIITMHKKQCCDEGAENNYRLNCVFVHLSNINSKLVR